MTGIVPLPAVAITCALCTGPVALERCSEWAGTDHGNVTAAECQWCGTRTVAPCRRCQTTPVQLVARTVIDSATGRRRGWGSVCACPGSGDARRYAFRDGWIGGAP